MVSCNFWLTSLQIINWRQLTPIGSSMKYDKGIPEHLEIDQLPGSVRIRYRAGAVTICNLLLRKFLRLSKLRNRTDDPDHGKYGSILIKTLSPCWDILCIYICACQCKSMLTHVLDVVIDMTIVYMDFFIIKIHQRVALNK